MSTPNTTPPRAGDWENPPGDVGELAYRLRAGTIAWDEDTAQHFRHLMPTLGTRLLVARNAADLSQEDLAAAANVSQGLITKIERDRAEQTRKILDIAKAVGVNAEWLGEGTGPALPARELTSWQVSEGGGRYEVAVASGETPPGYIRLPQLSTEASAGNGAIMEEQPEVVQYLDVAEWWAQQNLPRNLDRIRVMSARGDSMAPDIQHGDVLFIDIGCNRFVAEGVYVFHWHGRLLIKRLVPVLSKGTIAIVSRNDQYPPEHVTPGELDQLHIIGRLAAWWTLKRF